MTAVSPPPADDRPACRCGHPRRRHVADGVALYAECGAPACRCERFEPTAVSGPPADDQAAPSLEVVERALKMQAGSVLARQVLHLRSMLAERTAAVGDAANRYMAERARVAAVRALADTWMREQSEYPPTEQGAAAAAAVRLCAREMLVELTGPTEASAMRYELSCITCSPSPHFHLAPFESNAERQTWVDAHQAATGHEDFRFTNTPVSVGPAEAAEPTWLAAEGEALFRAQVAEAGAPEPDDYDGDELVLVRMPGRMSGRPTVGHSRLTLTTLLEYLRAGDSPELVLNAYPSVTREQMRVVAALALDLAEHDEMEGRAGIVTATPTEPTQHPLTAFADDIEQRMPNLRDPDPLSDWGKGVAWAVDRARNMAADSKPVAPALIGTYADPAFVAHQDHKHPVDGCGYCPTDFEETT